MNPHRFLSAAFAPQVSSAYWFSFLYFAEQRASNAFTALMIALGFSSVLQILVLLLYVKAAKVDVYVSERGRRGPVFAVSIVFYVTGLAALFLIGAPKLTSLLMLAYSVNTLIAYLVTLWFTKVSLHVWGISGPAIVIFYAFGALPFFALMALALLVGYSRVKTRAHTPWQVALAVFLSLLVTSLTLVMATGLRDIAPVPVRGRQAPLTIRVELDQMPAKAKRRSGLRPEAKRAGDLRG